MRRFAIAALALVLTGCLSEPTAPTATELAGTWVITNVNDQPIPYTFPNGATLTSGQMTLQIDGSYTGVELYSNGVVYTEAGAYTIFGIDILFTETTLGQQFGARWEAGTITKTEGAYKFTYRKQ